MAASSAPGAAAAGGAPASASSAAQQDDWGLDAEQLEFGFAERVERAGSGAVKWDLPELILDAEALALPPSRVDDRGLPTPPPAEGEGDDQQGDLPKRLQHWVADMDLPMAPALREELARFAAGTELMGYTCLRPSWFAAVEGWLSQRHRFDVTVGGTVQSSSVVIDAPHAVGGLVGLMNAVCQRGEKVAFFSPGYHPFFNIPVAAGCTAAPVPLLRDEKQQGEEAPTCEGYSIDWAALERVLDDPKVTAFISCNPHNPIGLVFTADDLLRLGELCASKGVFVLSDEVWADLVLPSSPRPHTMMASLNDTLRENTASVVSMQKTFNTAGLHMAVVVCHNVRVMDNLRAYFFRAGQFGPPTIAPGLYEAALSPRGEAWRQAVLRLLQANLERLTEGLRRACRHPGDVHVVTPQATYVVWTDWRRFVRTRRVGQPAAAAETSKAAAAATAAATTTTAQQKHGSVTRKAQLADGAGGQQGEGKEKAAAAKDDDGADADAEDADDAVDKALFRLVASRARVIIEPGRDFGPGIGNGFLRINIACAPAVIDDLIERLATILALPEVQEEE